MDNLSLIAAIGENRELGYNNNLIWHIKEDLMFYKKMTWGKNIIMGRRTLESLPKVALKGRKPIVLTSSINNTSDMIKYFNCMDKLLQYIENSDEEFMVIGGASVYEEFLPFVDSMFLTVINDPIKRDADCYFPLFDINDWETELIMNGNDNGVVYETKKYVRKKD